MQSNKTLIKNGLALCGEGGGGGGTRQFWQKLFHDYMTTLSSGDLKFQFDQEKSQP